MRPHDLNSVGRAVRRDRFRGCQTREVRTVKPRPLDKLRLSPGRHEGCDLSDHHGPDFDDDSELEPADDPWEPLDLDEDDEEPEPEYGDFWVEPDDFED